jgi:hypothetical protein
VASVLGSPDRPLPIEAATGKLDACLEFAAGSADRGAAPWAAVAALDDLEDAAGLANVLRRS